MSELEKLKIIDLRPKLVKRYDMPWYTKTHIVIHYNGPKVPEYGDPAGELRRIIWDAEYHMNKNWGSATSVALGSGIMYHYAVTSDGTIYQLRNLDPGKRSGEKLWHAGHEQRNRDAIAIHLPLGEGQDATPKQWLAVLKLVDALIVDFGMGEQRMGVLSGHSDWSSTSCPGLLYPRMVAARKNLLRAEYQTRKVVDLPKGYTSRIYRLTATVNARPQPDHMRTIPMGLKWKGETVDVDALVQGLPVGPNKNTVWAHVRADGVNPKGYYLTTEYLELVVDSYTVMSTALNVRSAPGTAAPYVRTVQRGDVVQIAEMLEGEMVPGVGDNWARIAGTNEYLHAAYLEKVSS